MNDNDRLNYISDVKKSLLSKSEQKILETIKSLNFLLPYEKEKIIFRDFVVKEKSEMIKN